MYTLVLELDYLSSTDPISVPDINVLYKYILAITDIIGDLSGSVSLVKGNKLNYLENKG